MSGHVLRRSLQMIPVLVGTTFLIYAMMWALPGDPLAGRCGPEPCPAAYVSRMTEAYNLADPLLVQYVKYMAGMVTGDFGTTFSGSPVADELWPRLPVTLQLAVLAVVVEIVLGIAAGTVAALRPGGVVDSAVLAATLLVISMPIFVLALAAQAVGAVRFGWFPVTSDGSTTSLILPALVLGSVSMAFLARVTRSGVLENLRAEHVRTAVAKGMPRRRVVVRHALRNSLVPVLTLVGADFGGLLGGAVVVEMVFNVGGVGDLLMRSIRDGEIGTVTAVVTLLVLAFLLVNLVVDILYPVLDPRIGRG